jgi:hypothetical protein
MRYYHLHADQFSENMSDFYARVRARFLWQSAIYLGVTRFAYLAESLSHSNRASALN